MALHPPSRRNQQTEPGVLTCNFLLLSFALMALSLAGCGALTKSSGLNTDPPSIAEQPADQTIVASQSATFSVAADGTPPFRYQWMKNGRLVSGATSTSYTTPAMTASDSGTRFAVLVRNAKGTAVSKAATVTVNAPGRLSASASSLNFGNVTIDKRISLPVTLVTSGGSGMTISNVSISGPGFNVSGVSSGLVLAPGQTMVLDVTFAPAASGSVIGSIGVFSDGPNPPTMISLSGSGVQPIAHSVSLTWILEGSNIIGYNIYRASISGGPYAKLTPSVDPTTSFTDTNVQAGQTYYYVATSVDSSDTESANSNEVSATIPPS
jgi:hypothetical protein